MAIEIIMPKVDMVMESGTFLEWLVVEGSPVTKGQPLFVIMTDKAAIEIESPASGVLAGVRAQPNETIAVTKTIAYILEPGEELPRKEEDATARKNVGSETKEVASDLLVNEAAAAVTGSQIEVQRGAVRATPLARRMAAHLGVDLKQLTGRGPKGRIHKADVLKAADDRSPAETGEIAPNLVAPAQAGLKIPLPDARKKKVTPLAGARKIIAERMVYSVMSAPHITLTIKVDMTEVMHLRSRVQKRLEQQTGYKLSLTAIIALVVAKALGSHPGLNASLSGDEIIEWEDVHLGIATYMDDYLVVPVIHAAQAKNLAQILTSLGDLVERARAKKLTPAEMSGSTFTISNMGMYGIESFTAIINPPEAAILAVGAVEEGFVKIDQQMVERPVMRLTLCADHRMVDGVAAARFLNEVKNTLEDPYILI